MVFVLEREMRRRCLKEKKKHAKENSRNTRFQECPSITGPGFASSRHGDIVVRRRTPANSSDEGKHLLGGENKRGLGSGENAAAEIAAGGLRGTVDWER